MSKNLFVTKAMNDWIEGEIQARKAMQIALLEMGAALGKTPAETMNEVISKIEDKDEQRKEKLFFQETIKEHMQNKIKEVTKKYSNN